MKLVVEGLDELRQRFKHEARNYHRRVRKTLEASLLTVWENVPSYPPKPATSNYVRTGTLGRSLGVSMYGQRTEPGADHYQEIKQGPQMDEATFGTRLYYAPYVVGEGTQTETFRRIGWKTLDGWVLRRVRGKIENLFKIMAAEMIRYLDGKGL